MPKRTLKHFLKRHSLSLTAAGVVAVLILLYWHADPSRHLGSFWGNAIADWSGLTVMAVASKHLHERNSRDKKKPRVLPPGLHGIIHEHSLTIFLLITGAFWTVLFVKMDANSRWGQVVGNLVSEWTQTLGLVLLTKRLVEVGTREKKEQAGQNDGEHVAPDY